MKFYHAGRYNLRTRGLPALSLVEGKTPGSIGNAAPPRTS
jgi:hypothetical protein